MKLTLEKGRPNDLGNRLQKEIRVYDYLDKLNIKYERVDHKEVETIEACKEVDEILNATICKNLFLCNSQKNKFYMLMMPGDKKLVAKELSKQIGSTRLSFASSEYMKELLDITPGSVSIMGLINDTEGRVQLLIDEDVIKGEYLGCHPCINTSSLRIRMKDILEVFLPAVKHEPILVSIK